MILKIKTNDEGQPYQWTQYDGIKRPNQWTLYDGIKRITYSLQSYGSVKECDYFSFVGVFPCDDDVVVAFISAFYAENREQTFLVTSETYLLNDEGKTIERIW